MKIKLLSIKLILCSIFIAGLYNVTSYTLASEIEYGETPSVVMVPNFADLAEDVINSVVNISTTQVMSNNDKPLSIPKDQSIPDFYKDWLEKNQEIQKKRFSSLGSGFIIDELGVIITNAHVIKGADEIEVIFSDGIKLKADIIGSDEKTDIAVLKVSPEEGQSLKALKFGSSEQLRVGDWVLAIGNPFGLGGTVTAGIVSAMNRDINAGPYDDFIQTDASINKGNSGGPLFNVKGEVIGINSAIISTSGGSVGIGFAIPSDTAVRVISQLNEFGETRRGWLGVRIQIVTEEIAEGLGLESNHGALIADVDSPSPASRAGIKAGDVIISFDGVKIKEMRELPKVVAQTKIGSNVDVLIVRNGKIIKKRVRIDRLDEKEAEISLLEDDLSKDSQYIDKLGFSLSKVSSSMIEKYNLSAAEKGLVVSGISSSSDAYLRGLREGDVINIVQEPLLLNVDQFILTVDGYRKENRSLMLLHVKRGSNMIKIFPIKIN
jgi:serine protease Do